ncbi:MAG: ATP-dependent RNA helicase DbpA [Deltaproteobacteria bacterium]|nr:ATP-dependent RNA helicase DbpA [Deltaproteobacteria bacterium]
MSNLNSSSVDFSSLGLHPDLLKNLESLSYHKMTPIQSQSLPLILRGLDVIGQGKTGSGKTASFGLGILQKLEVKRFRIQSLVLCPTRELADQVAKEIRRLARSIHNIKVLTLCGGVAIGPQIGSLAHGAHIIVGTPGRVEDHIRKGNLNLDHVQLLVLDEADRMLEMGFADTLDRILDYTPEKRQTLLFSATFPKEIQAISERVMQEPIMVKVDDKHDDNTIVQHFYEVRDNDERVVAIRLLLLDMRPESTVVFCNTKRECQDIADELGHHGFNALALHGDLEQRERDEALVRFSNKSESVLVATDVAARGLDIESLDMVINYHIARDPEIHVHRIGRTGRAGSKGVACSLFAAKEHNKISVLEDFSERTIEAEALPSLDLLQERPAAPVMVTVQVNGGKKHKIRPGDILGALTGEGGVAGEKVGKISIFYGSSFVAIRRESVATALKMLGEGKLKGRSFRARRI